LIILKPGEKPENKAKVCKCHVALHRCSVKIKLLWQFTIMCSDF